MHGVPTSLRRFMQAERAGLVQETRLAGILPFVAVNDLQDVVRVPSLLRAKHPASLRAINGAPGRAMAQSCPTLGYHSLWVTTANNEYRNDYLLFAQQFVDAGVRRLPEELHVDHLYNRARAAQYGLGYIRMALVPRGVNTSHGAAYEKAVTTSEEMREACRPHTMDEITCMKFLSFRSPRKRDYLHATVEDYIREAAQMFGIPEHEVRRNITELMDKAGSGWAAGPG